MYVIATMRWAVSKGKYNFTQIAYIKADEELTLVEKDHMFIKQQSVNGYDRHKWEFSGTYPEDYKNASCVSDVLARFEQGLFEDDVLIWWHK